MTTERDPKDERAQTWSLVWLCLVGVLGGLDQMLIYLLLQPMKLDLALTDTQLAIIAGSAVAVMGAVAAFPIGWLADRYGRRRVLAISMAVWSAATALCGLATSFAMVLAGSVGLALGEAGLYAIIYALIPQSVSDQRRPQANAIVLAVLMFASAGGLLLGSQSLFLLEAGLKAIGTDFPAWRVAFIIFGGLGLALSAIPFAIRLRPGGQAGQTSGGGGSQISFSAYLRRFGATIGGLFVALSLFGSASLLLLMWLPALYSRLFSVSAAAAGQSVGMANLLGTAVGVVAAFAAARYLAPRLGARFAPQMLFWGCALGIVPGLILWVSAGPVIFLIGSGAGIACVTLAISIAPMMIQDIAPPAFRSRAAGLMSIVGLPLRMLLPAVVGVASDAGGGTGPALLTAVGLTVSGCMAAAAALFWLLERRYCALVGPGAFAGRAIAAPAAPASVSASADHLGVHTWPGR